MSAPELLVVADRREDVVIVRIDRPERRNALNVAAFDALGETFASLADDAARAVIVTGAPGAFSAGADIRPDNPMAATMLSSMQSGDAAPVREIIERFKGVNQALADLPMPTIAAINGVAYGGGAELALSCDLRVVERGATICFSETRIGLIPDLGGTVRLVQLVGRARAIDLICTARDIDADEALRLGLVDRVAESGHSVDVALDLAASIAQNGPQAVRIVKKIVSAMGKDDAAMALETQGAVDAIMSKEAVEGIGAWLQKRPARFGDAK